MGRPWLRGLGSASVTGRLPARSPGSLSWSLCPWARHFTLPPTGVRQRGRWRDMASVSLPGQLRLQLECSPCPKGTFTRGENGVQQCHRCRSPCPAGFIEKTPCTATQDRICTCPPNTFLSGDGAAVCKPHSLCPPGKRVKKQGSEKKDVVCKQCSEGTFSDVKSSATQCRNHTGCQVQGLVLLSPGTREKDNICGPLSTAPSSEPIISSIFPAPLAGPAQKGEGWEFCLIIFYLNLYITQVSCVHTKYD
uniref:TNFR-Cys domain-containing protein n=1 Tax=Astatotilapia calliptera TaxID=8154 RepID=A0A3P8PAS0_ASTCA